MCKWINTITPEKTVAEAVQQMVDRKTNSLIVVDKDGRPVGLVSSHSLIRAVVPDHLKENEISSQFDAEGTFDKYADQVKDKRVEDVMYTDIHILNIEDAIIEAATYSVRGAMRVMPVVDESEKLVGVVTRTCIKNALYNAIFKDNQIDPTIDRNGECDGGKDQ